MWTGGYLPYPIWLSILILNIIIIVLVIFIVVVVKKYASAKEELKVIKGDTLPKTESEVNSGNFEDRIIYS